MRPTPDPIGPGQESAWSFPRPAIAEQCNSHIMIEHQGRVIGALVLLRVGWSYASNSADFMMLHGYVAFCAGPFDRCTVDGDLATLQPGDFYDGWITSGVTGPFKGVPGSMGW